MKLETIIFARGNQAAAGPLASSEARSSWLVLRAGAMKAAVMVVSSDDKRADRPAATIPRRPGSLGQLMLKVEYCKPVNAKAVR